MSKRPRVLYLSYDGMTDALGQSQVIAYLKRLSKRGVDFDLISFEKPERFGAKKKIIEEAIQDTSISWHPLIYKDAIPVLSTKHVINDGWQLATQLHKESPFQLVHARAQVMANIAYKVQQQYGIKWIFDMRGWWTDEKFESGHWDHFVFKPVYHYLKNQEKKFFRKADYVVSLTEAGKHEIISKGYKSENIGVIPTCVDFETFRKFDPEISKNFREELAIPHDAYVLIYSGSLGGSYNIDHIFSVFERLTLQKENCYFIVLSKEPYEADKEVIAKHALSADRIRYLSVDFNDVHKYLIASDLGLIVYERAYSAIGRSPTKLGEYWACGIPALSISGIGDIDTLINKYQGSGAVFANFNDEEIDKALTSILDDQAGKEKLREYAREYYDIERGVDFYFSLYNDLIN